MIRNEFCSQISLKLFIYFCLILFAYFSSDKESSEQAGAELCQADFKLGIAETNFPEFNVVFEFPP